MERVTNGIGLTSEQKGFKYPAAVLHYSNSLQFHLYSILDNIN